MVEENVCTWKHDSYHDMWDTSCGDAACFLSDGPKENHYHFCPFCGKPLVEEVEEPEDDEDA